VVPAKLRPPEELVVASEFFLGEKARKSLWLADVLSVFESAELCRSSFRATGNGSGVDGFSGLGPKATDSLSIFASGT